MSELVPTIQIECDWPKCGARERFPMKYCPLCQPGRHGSAWHAGSLKSQMRKAGWLPYRGDHYCPEHCGGVKRTKKRAAA